MYRLYLYRQKLKNQAYEVHSQFNQNTHILTSMRMLHAEVEWETNNSRGNLDISFPEISTQTSALSTESRVRSFYFTKANVMFSAQIRLKNAGCIVEDAAVDVKPRYRSQPIMQEEQHLQPMTSVPQLARASDHVQRRRRFPPLIRGYQCLVVLE